MESCWKTSHQSVQHFQQQNSGERSWAVLTSAQKCGGCKSLLVPIVTHSPARSRRIRCRCDEPPIPRLGCGASTTRPSTSPDCCQSRPENNQTQLFLTSLLSANECLLHRGFGSDFSHSLQAEDTDVELVVLIVLHVIHLSSVRRVDGEPGETHGVQLRVVLTQVVVQLQSQNSETSASTGVSITFQSRLKQAFLLAPNGQNR